MLKLARICRKTGANIVNDVINLLKHPELSITELREKCKEAKDCIRLENLEVEMRLNGFGFQRVVLQHPSSCLSCDLYYRSPIHLLRQQVRNASAGSTFFTSPNASHHEHREQLFHPMMAELGKNGSRAVKQKVLDSLDYDTFWHTLNNYNEQSFAGMLQLYSDKSKTSLKETAFQFYPLHMTILNFCEQHRRYCIMNGMTTVAFLPIKFYVIEDGNKVEQRLNRLQRFEMIHLCISKLMQEMKTIAMKGFPCLDKEGNRRRCHPCVASYCCDLPERKDLTAVKNGNSNKRNYHRCMVQTVLFNTYTNAYLRNDKYSTEAIKKARECIRKGLKEDSEVLMYEHSLIDQLPVLHDFAFMGDDQVLDIHAIFGFEPLHNLLLGIFKELKRCLSERLKSTSFLTSSVPTKIGNSRTALFKTVRATILTGINRLLAHIQTTSDMKGLRIDISSGSKGEVRNGLYNEKRDLVGMLEARDYRNVDLVFPFIGMFLDRCCDEVSDASATTVFVLYVDIMQESLSYNNHTTTWTLDKINKLETKIIGFKEITTALYGEFHSSSLPSVFPGCNDFFNDGYVAKSP